jgi:hypothetical protein
MKKIGMIFGVDLLVGSDDQQIADLAEKHFVTIKNKLEKYQEHLLEEEVKSFRVSL